MTLGSLIPHEIMITTIIITITIMIITITYIYDALNDALSASECMIT